MPGSMPHRRLGSSAWPARRRRPTFSRLLVQRLESRLALAAAPQAVGTVLGPTGFTPLGSHVVFGGSSSASGYELWKTDGTAAGTELLKDIRAAAGSSYPAEFTAIGSILCFIADDGINGMELWRTDGTAAGTFIVKDINPGAGSSAPTGLTAVGQAIYFSADDGTKGRELWKTDGTTNGTVRVRDINPNGGSSNPRNFTAGGAGVFFMADDGSVGRELWKTDGTAAGTVLVRNIAGGAADAFDYTPSRWLTVGSTLYFKADDGISGAELWKTDGTDAGTVPVADLNFGPGGSEPRGLTLLGSQILFWANDGTSNRFWSSDGTGSGTASFHDFGPTNSPVPGDHLHRSYTATVAGIVYFSFNDGVLGSELWKTDGSGAGTALVKDINDGGSANIKSSFKALGSTLFFRADNFNPKTGYELWRSDGTANGTVLVKDLAPGQDGGFPDDLAVNGQKLYFSAKDGPSERRLWVLDTAATATVPAAPTAVTGAAGDGQVVLSWAPPADDGGSAIASYVVEYSADSGATWKAFAYEPASPPAATVAVTGLANGTGYVFRVSAVNGVGPGPASSPSAVVAPVAPKVAAVVFTDAFARTDDTPLPPPWRLATGAATIASGRLAQATAAETVAVVDGLSAADVRVEATVNLAAAGQAGLTARVTGAGKTPSLYVGGLFKSGAGATAAIWRRSGGEWKQIGASVAAPATSGALSFRLIGPTLTLALNDVPLVVATDLDGALTDPGSAGVWLAAGSGATVDDVSVAELVPTDALRFALQSDTGPGAGDSITSGGTVAVKGLAPQASWQWSTDGGTTWTTGAGDTFALPTGTFDAGSVRVQQLTPSVKTRSSAARIVVDQAAPAAAALARLGSSATMLVSGLEPGAAWRYSVDGGAAWTPGPGTNSFSVPAGPYLPSTIRVVQTDLAGNDAPAAGNAPGFYLDVAGTVPVFADAFNRPDASPFAGTLWRFAAGAATILSGRMRQSVPAETAAVVDGLLATDQRVQAVVNLANAGQAGLVARVTGTGPTLSFYVGFLTKTASGVSAEIWRRTGSTWKQVGAGVAAPAAAGTLTLHIVGTRLTLSMNAVPLVVATDSAGALTGAGAAGVWLKDGAGATVDGFSVAEVPPVGAVGFALNSDSGVSAFDWITKDGIVNVTGLAASATWRWTRDGGVTWTKGSGTFFSLPAGTYAAGAVRVQQQTPVAKIRRSAMRITVDATPPPAPSIARSKLAVSVTGLEPYATYRFSIDGGATWTPGTASSFDLAVIRAVAGQVRVVQTDRAGNDGPSAVLPAFQPLVTPLANDAFSRPDGTVLGKATGASGSWIQSLGSFKLSGGAIQPATAGTSLALLPGGGWVVPGFHEADVRVSAAIDVRTSAGAGVVARSSGSAASGSMLFGFVSRTVSGGATAYRAEIWRQKGGVLKLLSSAPVSAGAGALQLDCIGRLAVLSFKGVVVTSFHDASPEAVTGPGTTGLRFSGTAARADDFSASRLTL